MRSFSTPTPEQVDRALASLGRPGLVRYFFDRLENPKWVRPLQDRGVFAHPPEVERNEAESTIGFPAWPVSQYLARVAEAAPEAVIDAALSIPETENERVHEDLAQAALRMPADFAARWARAEIPWLQRREYLFMSLSDYLSALVAHLGGGGEVDAAFDLADALLELRPPVAPPADEEGYRPSPEPHGRMRDWDYADALARAAPALTAADGERALTFFVGLLDRAIAATRPEAPAEDDEDLSYLWRSTIEGDDADRTERIVWSLVSAVRDASLSIARTGEAGARRAVALLEARRWVIYRRLVLHLLGAAPASPADLVVERLTAERYFEASGARYEYLGLLQRRFPELSEAQQRTVLGWIDGRAAEIAADADRAPEVSAQELADRRWLHWLGVLRDGLPEPWRTRYAELEARYGPPTAPEPMGIVVGWTGEQSPRTADELRRMPIDDLLAFVGGWIPSANNPFGPSRSGLVRALTEVVAADPAAYAPHAARVAGMDAPVVVGVLQAFRQAVEADRAFPWDPVLDLCAAVARPEESVHATFEPDWESARSAVARLLSAGLGERPTTVPFALRDRVWAVLRPLTDDVQPDPAYEATYGGTNMNPATLSLNTVRGEAMHAVVRYALWVRRHLDRAGSVAAGFAPMPEVREVLDDHLAIARDPSLAVRSVYGQWLPYLLALDQDWTARNIPRIFPTDPELVEFRRAAWASYVNFSPPHLNLFPLLRGDYRAAIARMTDPRAADRHFDHADARSGQHLMVFYWHGRLALDDGLVVALFAEAPASVRGGAISFIGRSLQSTDEPPPEVADRLRALWDARLAAARTAADPRGHSPELAAFGWWFASGKLDEEWAIRNLQGALGLHPETEVDHLVVERLEALAARWPNDVVVCLRLLANEGRGWALLSWRDEAVRVLRAVLASGDPRATEEARALANALGALGHQAFRALGL